MTMLHTSTNTFRGVGLNNVCIKFEKFRVPSNETIVTFQPFHPLAKVDFPPFVNDFHLKIEVTSHQKAFIFALTCSPHLISSSLSSTMYKFLLQYYFVPYDSMSGFEFFLGMRAHCSWSCSFIYITFIYNITILTLEKQISNIRPITIGKVIYQLVDHIFVGFSSRIHLLNILVLTNLAC
jgi:hypothetical protein